MRNHTLCLWATTVLTALLSGGVHAQSVPNAPAAQDVYIGLGLPGVLSIGYAKPLGDAWGVRAEYAGGMRLSQDGTSNGLGYAGTFTARHSGVFADWFAFGNGFRLVGGVTVNDIKFSLVGNGTGTATINGKEVSMVGQTFNLDIKYPTTTPYIGIGYGHHTSSDRGLGWYADLGLMLGTFTTEVHTSLVNQTINGQTITQSDVDAQTESMRSAIADVHVLPRIAMGAVYRF